MTRFCTIIFIIHFFYSNAFSKEYQDTIVSQSPVRYFIDSLEANGVIDWVYIAYYNPLPQRPLSGNLLTQGSCHQANSFNFVFWKFEKTTYIARIDPCYIYREIEIPGNGIFSYYRIVKLIALGYRQLGVNATHYAIKGIFLGSFERGAGLMAMMKKERIRPIWRYYQFLFSTGESIEYFEPKKKIRRVTGYNVE